MPQRLASRAWMRISLTLAVGAALPALALAQEIGEVRDRFIRSSAAAEVALERALREASPEARPALERALGEVRAARGRTLEELTKAQSAAGAGVEGRTRAREAVDRGTQVHLRVLQDVLGKVPEQAKPAIEHALEVSKTGRERALGAVEGERGAEARPGPPSGTRIGPPSGVRPGPPAGIGGPPSGVPGGPPGGVPGGRPGGRPGR